MMAWQLYFVGDEWRIGVKKVGTEREGWLDDPKWSLEFFGNVLKIYACSATHNETYTRLKRKPFKYIKRYREP
jgi:hypothetical protein